MRKKGLHIMLAVVLLLNLLSIRNISNAQPISEVEICEILGILKGDSTGLSEEYLSKSTERLQAVILTLRLAGNNYENLALNYESSDNFTDTDQMTWEQGKNVLAYIKKNPQFGWRGNTDGSFNPKGKVTYQMLYKVLLEALGYKQDYGEGGDFKWEDVPEFAFNVGLWDITGINELTNRDMAIGIVEALQIEVKDSKDTLLETLVQNGAIDAEKAKSSGLLNLTTNIISLKEIDLGNVYDDEKILLPDTVTATYSDGSEKDVSVSWHYDYKELKEGQNTIVGDVEGTEIKAFANVNWLIKSLEVVSVDINNLIQIELEFNKGVDISRALNTNNYEILVGNESKKISQVDISTDRKTLTLFMDAPFKPQENVDITIKKEIGIKRDYYKTVENVIDRYEPKVKEVRPLGNKIIRVVFSEPVKYANNSSNYTLDGRIIGVSGLKMVNPSTVDINLSKRLENGKYSLGIRTGIVDYAGFRVLTNPIDFVIEDDSTTLDIDEIINVTQTRLEVIFTKPVEPIVKDQILAKQGARVSSIEYKDDMKTYAIEFERTAAISAEGTEVNFFNVTDLFGNKTSLKINVVPTIDTSTPEFVDYEIKDQDKIILEYTKDVIPTGATYVLKNFIDENVSLAQTGWFSDGTGKTYRNKVVLQRPGGAVFEPGSYVLTIQDVVDYTPQENRIIPLNIEISVVDDISPEVKSVKIKDRQIFVNFSERLDSNTATSENSYRYLSKKTYASDIFPKGTTYELIAGERTVVISIPEEFDIKKIDVLQISLVTDLSGNVMDPKGIEAPFATIDTSPRITTAYVTGKNTVILNLSREINADTLAAEDFILTAGDYTLNIEKAEYDEENRKITLYVQELISSSGQYSGNDIYIMTSFETPNTLDVYGQPIQPLGKPIRAIDKYQPYATGFVALNNGENTDIIISINENIRTSYGTGKPLANNSSELGQFIILANNIVAPVISSKYEEATSTGTARIILTISGNKADNKIRVMFFAGPNNTLADYSPSANPLANFELP